MRFFLEVCYDGSAFHGYQIQPNATTVQDVLEHALSTILGHKTLTIASGRTDTGVHAFQQFVHFDTKEKIVEEDLSHRLNSFLPKEIAIKSIRKVVDSAHARFDAVSRAYRYQIHHQKDPFLNKRSLFYPHKLNLESIDEACELLKKHRNFQAMSKVHTEVNHFDCEIFEAKWERLEQGYTFYVKANRFLRGMVRALVGTLLDVGCEKISIDDLQLILDQKDRSKAGRSVEPYGLYLSEVEYPTDIFEK